jgi:hypothetical protein
MICPFYANFLVLSRTSRTASYATDDAVKVFLLKQNKLHERVQELQNSLTALLQKEVNQLTENQSTCETLCAHETAQLNEEIYLFIEYLNINVESKYICR